MTVIELPDQQAAALGLTLQKAWLKKLTDEETPSIAPSTPQEAVARFPRAALSVITSFIAVPDSRPSH